MSVQAMSWVIERSPHKGSELLLLLMIANHAAADGSNAFPSVNLLARECRMSPRQIIRMLHRLEASGAIVVQERAGPRGAHLMRVIMDANAPKITEVDALPTPDKMSAPKRRRPDKLSVVTPDILSGLRRFGADILSGVGSASTSVILGALASMTTI